MALKTIILSRSQYLANNLAITFAQNHQKVHECTWNRLTPLIIIHHFTIMSIFDWRVFRTVVKKVMYLFSILNVLIMNKISF